MDSSLWGFEAEEVYDRRAYFWNLLQAILWQASNFSFLVAPAHKFFFRVWSLAVLQSSRNIPSDDDEKNYETGDAPLGCTVIQYYPGKSV